MNPTVDVSVKLFATLRRNYPEVRIGEAIPVSLPEGTTIGQLVERLDLPNEPGKLIFVDGRRAGEDHVLRDGDEIGLFPPVGGG